MAELADYSPACPARFNAQTLSLLEGQNFAPAYLKIQPTGTVPALVDLQGEVLDSTVKVVKYLIANAPKQPESWEPATPEIVEAFHACVLLLLLNPAVMRCTAFFLYLRSRSGPLTGPISTQMTRPLASRSTCRALGLEGGHLTLHRTRPCISSLDDATRKAKAEDVPGKFWNGRQG